MGLREHLMTILPFFISHFIDMMEVVFILAVNLAEWLLVVRVVDWVCKFGPSPSLVTGF
jgi:hypothetical protein